MRPRGSLDKGRWMMEGTPGTLGRLLVTTSSFPPCSRPPCLYRAGHSSEAVLPDGHPGLPDLDPERALWAFICGGPRGAVCLQCGGSGAARRGERWGRGRHTEGRAQGVWPVQAVPQPRGLSWGQDWRLLFPSGFRQVGGLGACVRMGTRGRPWRSSSCVCTWHTLSTGLSVTSLMRPFRSSDLLGGPG